MSMTQDEPGTFTSSVAGTPALTATGANRADGVTARSDDGSGVNGSSNHGNGVSGTSVFGAGVEGFSKFSVGVRGSSEGGVNEKGSVGVGGEGNTGVSGQGLSIGVYGSAEVGPGNLAGKFDGDVQVNGNFSVTGNKAFVQAHPTDPEREIVYVALEGGEAGTYVRGSGQLQSGKAVLALPEHFGLVTDTSGLTVQLTPRGEWLQLYAVELDTAQLVVREAQGKSGAFDYLIQGVRRGSESHEVIRTRR